MRFSRVVDHILGYHLARVLLVQRAYCMNLFYEHLILQAIKARKVALERNTET